MSRRICPQTGEDCPIAMLCEAETVRARQRVKNAASESLRIGRVIAELGNEPNLTGLIKELEGGEIPSPEAAENIGILSAHAAIAEGLPVPMSKGPETPHDTYDQLTQTISLNGTYELANSFLDRPRDETIPVLSEFIILAAIARRIL